MEYTLKNVYIEKALQLGSSKNAKQLFLSMSKTGEVTSMGNWEKREALFYLEDLILREDSMGREWLPGDGETFPKLTVHIQHIFKKTSLIKLATLAALNWIMKHSNAKLGWDKFLGWWFPVEKEFFTNSSTLLHELPSIFTLDMIIPWMEFNLDLDLD